MSDVAQQQPNVKEIFLRASELLNEQERRAYLAEACGRDSVLQQHIELMVRANLETGTNPLDRMGAVFGATGAVRDAERPVLAHLADDQRMIGPYKLLEQIGEGGFGTVYMADQTTPFRRKVAVKVLNPGMNSREVLARFEAERQALAMMDHPNIARVLDAGTTAEGRPYFAMELVRGVPVTEYCDEARLTTDERLTLFIDICRAVQHAHQKGIIHRDLKPSNVLVTMHDDTAVPKVIDFGIAKALSQQLTDRTLFTGYHQLLGTPMYMSPEQAQMSGIDVDTRSDVYSLGVLLYELLTGTTPFTKESLSNASFDELRRMIREQEPPRPSARLTTLDALARSTVADRRKIDERRISDLLRSELDWIVMKALEKDRNRRYESASALATDVQRYLTGEPVQACPPTVGYRFAKYARRHRALILTGGSVAASLVLGTAISLWQVVLAGQERDRAVAAEGQAEVRTNQAIAAEAAAQQERARAEQNMQAALAALEQLLNHVANPDLAEIPELHATYEQILQDALAFYDQFTSKLGTSRELQYRVVGVLLRLGTLANETLQSSLGAQAYERAILLADGLVQHHPDRREYQELQATTYREAGGFYIARNTAPSEAELAPKYLEQSRLFYERLSLLEPARKDYVQQQVSALRAQVNLRLKTSATDETIPVLLQQAERLMDRSGPDLGLLKAMAELAAPSDPERADELFRSAVNLSESRLVQAPNRKERHAHAWLAYHAARHLQARHAQEADRLYTQSVDLLITLCRDFPSIVNSQNLLMEATNDYAKFLIQNERGGDARRILERAKGVVGPQVSPYNIRNRARPEFALGEYMLVLSDLKTVLERDPTDLSVLTVVPATEAAAAADPGFRAAYLNLVDEAVAKNQRSSEVLAIRASILAAFGDLQKARADLDVVTTADDASWHSLYSAGLLALALDADSRYPEICQRMLTRFRGSKDREGLQFTAWTCTLAPDAVDDYAEPLAIAESGVAREPDNRQYLTTLGAVQFRAGLHQEALATFEKAAAVSANENSSSAYDYYFRALVEHALERPDAARQSLAKANELAAVELENDANPPTWNRKLTLELLRNEAEGLISTVVQDHTDGE